MSAQLLAIVEVSKEDRVQCQAPSCGHGVYKRIHVVQDQGRLTVLGSDCFARLYGGSISTAPRYGSGDGRRLTADERRLLQENTQRFIDALEAERLQVLQEYERLRAARQTDAQRGATEPRTSPAKPPHRLPFPTWLKQLSPAQHSAFVLVRNQVRDEMRRNGMNPDLAGWVGLVDADARKRFETQQASGTAAP